MTEIINHKKESPLLGLLGVGGGLTGLGLAGGITPDGQELFGTAGGTFSWLCPSGVTSVSVVCIGAGGGGGGGAEAANGVYTGGGGGASCSITSWSGT